jgi:hypothetical protein
MAPRILQLPPNQPWRKTQSIANTMNFKRCAYVIAEQLRDAILELSRLYQTSVVSARCAGETEMFVNRATPNPQNPPTW